MQSQELKTANGHVLVQGGKEYPEVISRRSNKGKTYQVGKTKFVHLGKHEYLHYKENGAYYDIDLTNPDSIKAPYLLTRTKGIGYKFQARGKDTAEITVQMLEVPEKLSPEYRDGGIVYYTDVDTDLDVYLKPQTTRYGLYKVLKSDKASRIFQFEIGWSKAPKSVLTARGAVDAKSLGAELSRGIEGLLSLYFGESLIPACKAWDVNGLPVEVRRSIKGNVLTEEVILPEGFDAFPVTLDVETELKEESGTWEAPENVKSPITVECWGGGGAGGGGGTEGRGGGGGGAYVRASVDVIAGNEYSYTVGVGGLGNTSGTGGAGGDTQWGDGIIVKATGGAGGTRSVGGAGGAAVDCNGEIKYSGGTGGSRANNVAGGGGSGAGSTGNGNDGGNRSGGAAVPEYGGKGGDGAPSGGNGEPGENYGGGGGGGRRDFRGVGGRGGNGAPGLIRLTYEVITTVDITISPTVGAISLAGISPTTKTGISAIISASVGELTAQGVTPATTAGIGIIIKPPVGFVDAEGIPADVLAFEGILVRPPPGEVEITGVDPIVSVSSNVAISCGVGELQAEGFAPETYIETAVHPSVGGVEVSGVAPSMEITRNITIRPTVGEVGAEGIAADVIAIKPAVIQPPIGETAVGGVAPTVTAIKSYLPAYRPDRELRAKALVTAGGATTEYDDHNIASITLDETVNPDDSFSIGSAASAKLEITLLDIPRETVFDGAVIKPYLGFVEDGEVVEYVPLGIFNVDDISWRKDGNLTSVTLTCFDRMVLLETAYILSALEYPASLRDVAAEIASKAKVTFNAVSLAALPEAPVPELMGYTLREAIGFVASYVGGFACFNRDGELEVRTFQGQEPAAKIRPFNYFSFETSENEFFVGRLACQAGEDEDGNPLVLVSGTTGNEITFENPWMTQAQLDSIHAALTQLSYMPYTLRWQGDPALRAGDKVAITDRKGNIYTTLLMEQQLRYTGGLSATAEAKGKTELAQEFQSAGPLTLKLSRQSSVKAYADRLVQMLADGEFEGGTFIDGNMVVSPIIAGMEGRFSGELKVGTGNDLAGISGDGSSSSSIRFWAGHATKTSAPFRVTQAGVLTATNATITGTINATGGTFSGSITVTGTISGGTISGASISGGSINIGSGSFIVSSLGSISGANGNFYVPYNGDGVYNDYNGVARWKYTDAHYIRQDENYIDLYQGNGIIFRFDHESISGHSRMRFADGCLKSLSGTERLQVRDYSDSYYIPIWASQFYEASKSEYKKNILPAAKGMLDKVVNTPVYRYDRKRDKPDPGDPAEIGLIWEEVPDELRHRDGALNLATLVGVLWKAVQELDAKVEKLGGVK